MSSSAKPTPSYVAKDLRTMLITAVLVGVCMVVIAQLEARYQWVRNAIELPQPATASPEQTETTLTAPADTAVPTPLDTPPAPVE